jgi:hypothetical protein
LHEAANLIIAEISEAQKFLNALLAIVVCHSVKLIFIDSLFLTVSANAMGKFIIYMLNILFCGYVLAYMPHFFG